MNVSKKYIISIWEFAENYLGVMYDGNYKLTHDELRFYLREKLDISVRREGFNRTNKAKLLSGEVILVRDEEGKVIPYSNPRRKELDIDEINSNKNKSIFNLIGNIDDKKSLGRDDYSLYKSKKDKILPKKKRMVRRKYN